MNNRKYCWVTGAGEPISSPFVSRHYPLAGDNLPILSCNFLSSNALLNSMPSQSAGFGPQSSLTEISSYASNQLFSLQCRERFLFVCFSIRMWITTLTAQMAQNWKSKLEIWLRIPLLGLFYGLVIALVWSKCLIFLPNSIDHSVKQLSKPIRGSFFNRFTPLQSWRKTDKSRVLMDFIIVNLFPLISHFHTRVNLYFKEPKQHYLNDIIKRFY